MASAASPDNIDMSHVWRAARRSLLWVVPLCVLAGGVTYVAVGSMAPRYQSEAQVVVSARGLPNPFADPARDQAGGDVAVRMDKEAVNTHVSALMSIGLGETIASDLKLAERPEFNSAAGDVDAWSAFWRRWGFGAPKAGESDLDRVLAVYGRQLEVFSPKESRTINVRFTSVDPDLAAAIANRLVETYRTNLTAKTVGETGQVLRSLAPEIENLAGEVGRAERAAQEFRGKANIFSGGQQATGLDQQQLSELSAELSRTKASRSDAEARMASAEALSKTDAVDTLPDVQKSPLIQSLIQSRVRVERQIAELSATLLPGHPRMRQLNSDLAGLKRQIGAEIRKIVDGLGKEVTVARLREAALGKNVDDVKLQIVRQSPDEVTLRQLEAAAKSKRAELERLQAQYESNRARATGLAIPVETQIVTHARPSAMVIYPKKLPATLAVALATLLAGLGLVLTRAIIAGARGGDAPAPANHALAPDAPPADVAAPATTAPDLTTPPLTVVPMPHRTKVVNSAAELASGIAASHASGKGLRLVVVGQSQTVDAAQEALQLAAAVSASGRSTILIDWRSPRDYGCASLAGLAALTGVTDILQGIASLERTVRAIPGQSAHYLGGGQRAASIDDVDRDRLNMLLDALDETYDVILVTGCHDNVRRLFEKVDGRFDVAVSVSPSTSTVDGRYLDFEVDDMELFHLASAARPQATGRIRRVLQPAKLEAVTA